MQEKPEKDFIIYTIGHSNLRIPKFISLLKQYNVQVIVDVRSSPYSKYVPQFNREVFIHSIGTWDIDYEYLGNLLGGRPNDPDCYKNGKLPEDGKVDFLHIVDYPKVMIKEWYLSGIQRLFNIAKNKQTAIMCSEEDPAKCHRQHLISQTLLEMGIDVRHIRKDGMMQKAWLLLPAVEEIQPEQLKLF